MFVPGSHRWRTNDEVPADAADRLRAFEARAGSIVVMEGRMWHTSGANVTEAEDRALLFGYYCRAFLRPQMNWNVTIPADLQAELSPEMRHWLGLEALANTAFGAHLHNRRRQPQGQ
jgi:ectoine hydroxylase-related dioxygenase (phytanoyl-CoA dioxygenase family)